jgi:hypothetical protein
MNGRFAPGPFPSLLLAGLLPIVAAGLAFAINMMQGLEGCVPFWDGCLSVSRGIRSGPGLMVFKVLAVPAAGLLWWGWHGLQHEAGLRGASAGRLRCLILLGKLGAVFFLVYALWLGTEGDIYHWLRRYGVVFYFGLTGLAHLLLLAAWPRDARRASIAGRAYALMVWLTWGTGVASAFKRKLIDDPQFLDRVENALEWHFALYLSLCFVALAFALRARAP